jgi:hypothetical protein
MTDDQININITLKPDSIINAYTSNIKKSYESIALCLQSLEISQVNDVPAIKNHTRVLTLLFSEQPDGTINQARQWLLRQGFTDIIQCLSYSIIEALWLVEIVNLSDDDLSKIRSQPDLESIKKKYEKESFKVLLDQLLANINFEVYENTLRSLNKARASLSHSNVVREQDAYPPDSNSITITWYYDQLIIRGNESTEVVKPNIPIKTGGQPGIRIESKQKQFQKGDSIEFSTDEFVEIVFTGLIISQALAAKIKEKIDTILSKKNLIKN